MIESLHSPHVARVKALLSSKKERQELGLFVAEGLQGVREAIQNNSIETLYLTASGQERLSKANIDFNQANVIEIAGKVAEGMSDAITSQGIIAICKLPNRDKKELLNYQPNHLIFLDEIQDPGNAGTILRTADAMGIKAIITSPGSVDFYSPKVVRATAGSLWHIPVFNNTELDEVFSVLPSHKRYVLDASGDLELTQVNFDKPALWIFGNEARGLKRDVAQAIRVSIKMPGNAESLNLAASAAIVMHQISRG